MNNIWIKEKVDIEVLLLCLNKTLRVLLDKNSAEIIIHTLDGLVSDKNIRDYVHNELQIFRVFNGNRIN